MNEGGGGGGGGGAGLNRERPKIIETHPPMLVLFSGIASVDEMRLVYKTYLRESGVTYLLYFRDGIKDQLISETSARGRRFIGGVDRRNAAEFANAQPETN